MAKTKASDRIRLPDGRELTLGEAIDTGAVTLNEQRYYDPPRYFARYKDEVSWEINKTLWAARCGQPLPFVKCKIRR